MQRQNEWSSNRGYAQHLDVLKRISSRKLQVHRKFTSPKLTLEVTSDGETRFERSGQSGIVRIKENMATFRDQQILWQNYHLGKRIIEAPPVISKKKLEEDYQRHRRMVQCLTSASKRTTNEFRVKKLQEYKENVELQVDQRTLVTAANRSLIKLQINSLAFYRQRPALDNLDIVFSYTNKNGKNLKQSSQRFPAEQLLQKHFYFAVTKRLLNYQQAITIEVRNLKGLGVYSIGHFSFPSSIQLEQYQAQLFHCGKPIGEIIISTAYSRKAQFRTSQPDPEGQ